MTKRFFFAKSGVFSAIAAVAATLAVAGCSGGVDNDQLRVDVVAGDDSGFSVNRLPLPTPSAYLRASTAQGLVTFDAQGRVVPALASRWMVTEDGQTFAFRLNKARWNNMREIDTGEVAAALNRRIRELRGKPFGGALDNIIAAERMTGRVMQIRLRAPMPNLLEYLASPEFGIVHEANGSGPMIARAQSGHQILSWREEDANGDILLSDRRILLHKNPAVDALARLKEEQTDLVTGGGFATLPYMAAAELPDDNRDAGNRLGLFGLLLVRAGPFLGEKENREAIAMALNRPRMLSVFEGADWRAQQMIVPDGIADRGKVTPPDWTRLNFAERRASAQRIIARWEQENGEVRPLRIALPEGPGVRMLFAWLRADLRAIGLDAEPVGLRAPTDFRLIDRLADATSAEWYLGQLSCLAAPVCDEDADALLTAARGAQTAGERQQLLGEAETAYQELRNYIPIANPLRWSAYREGLQGYEPNSRGWHYLQTLGSGPTLDR